MMVKRLAWIVGLGLWLCNTVVAQQIAAMPQGDPIDSEAPSEMLDHPPEGQITVLGPVLRGFAWDKDAPGAKVSVRVTITTRAGESLPAIVRDADAQGAYSPEVSGGGHDFVIRLHKELAAVDRAKLTDVSLRLEIANIQPDGAPGEWVGGPIAVINLAERLPPAPDPVVITRKVLLIKIDPICHTRGGQKFSDLCKTAERYAGDPRDLANRIAAAFRQDSGGIMNFEILPETEYDQEEWPVMRWPVLDGRPEWVTSSPAIDDVPGPIASHGPNDYVYGEQYAVMDLEKKRQARWFKPEKDLRECSVDYNKFATKHNLEARHQAGEFDEVWVYGWWACGFWEATMGGGQRPFHTNSAPMGDPSTSEKPFDSNRGCIIMGFNYERGVGEALESFGHRMEGTLNHVFGDYRRAEGCGKCECRIEPMKPAIPSAKNPWARFGATEVTATAQAGVGDMHYAPQTQCDYQWDEPRFVQSSCDDWLLWPNLRGETSVVNHRDYLDQYPKMPSIEAHHRWWFDHLPRAAGSTDGRLDNWWHYFAYPDLVMQEPHR